MSAEDLTESFGMQYEFVFNESWFLIEKMKIVFLIYTYILIQISQ